MLGLESRHAGDMKALIEKLGGEAISAPSMREIPLEDQQPAFEFAERLLAGECDVLVLLTGVGFSTLVDAMCLRHDRTEVLQALSSVTLACRGPKPVRVLKALGLTAAIVAPEPNTSEELLSAVDARLELGGKRVFVQEYGRSNPELLRGLEARGAQVVPVPVYGWRLPEDTGPLERAVERLSRRTVDVALFTSARQVDHLLEIARRCSQEQNVLRALNESVVVASVGPVTSESLIQAGIAVDTEPEHSKMGQLITHAARTWRELAPKKRAAK